MFELYKKLIDSMIEAINEHFSNVKEIKFSFKSVTIVIRGGVSYKKIKDFLAFYAVEDAMICSYNLNEIEITVNL